MSLSLRKNLNHKPVIILLLSVSFTVLGSLIKKMEF